LVEKTDSGIEEGKIEGVELIELKNISKQYREETTILKGVDLCIEDGDYIALMGPSGAGKTTLMNIMGCLDRATQGEYFLDGNEISDYPEKEKARLRNEKFGFVVQDFALINEMTVYENVRLPLRYRKKRLKKEREHIESILKSLEIEDKKEIRVCDLSGGQQQRVAIARAIVNSPEIILADEPTGALDQETGREVMEIFSKLNQQGKTIIIVTHDPNIAAKCNRIVKMVDGKIQE
jgi:putative ABC transport system ATP-binding protein